MLLFLMPMAMTTQHKHTNLGVSGRRHFPLLGVAPLSAGGDGRGDVMRSGEGRRKGPSLDASVVDAAAPSSFSSSSSVDMWVSIARSKKESDRVKSAGWAPPTP